MYTTFTCIITSLNCRRSHILILVVAAVLLDQGAHAQRRFRPPFTLPPINGTAPTLISCESVLVKANPENYSHCHCEFGSWSNYRFSSYESSSTCPSGSKYVLESTRRRLSNKCTRQPATERRTKDVCKWCLHTFMLIYQHIYIDTEIIEIEKFVAGLNHFTSAVTEAIALDHFNLLHKQYCFTF